MVVQQSANPGRGLRGWFLQVEVLLCYPVRQPLDWQVQPCCAQHANMKRETVTPHAGRHIAKVQTWQMHFHKSSWPWPDLNGCSMRQVCRVRHDSECDCNYVTALHLLQHKYVSEQHWCTCPARNMQCSQNQTKPETNCTEGRTEGNLQCEG